MRVTSSLRLELRKRGRFVPRLLLLGLCLLIVFAPKINESAGLLTANPALSAAGQTYSLLALPPRGIDLQRPRVSQIETFRRASLSLSPLASTSIGHSFAFFYGSSLSPLTVPEGMSRGSRYACRLSDLPRHL